MQILGWFRFCGRVTFSLFHSHPPLSSMPFPLPSYSPSSIKGLALVTAVKDLLSKGAIEQVSPGPGFYSRLFITPKVTGGWQLVIDLSCLNRFVRLAHLRMETAHSVLQSIRSGDWMISLDLQDAYLQVPVHPQSRRYLRFCLGDQVYQFRVLCFGLSSAPQVFTRVMAPVFSVMHRSGFRILRYLDDWLVLWILPAGDHSGEGLPSRFMCRAQDSRQLAQELPHAFSALGLPGDDSSVFSFEGFSDSGPGAEGSLSRRRILLLSRAASQSLAFPVRGDVLPVHPHSGLQAPDAVTPATSSGVSPSGFSDSVSLLGRLLPEGSSVVVRSIPSRGRGGLTPSTSGALLYTDASDRVGERLSAQTISPAGGLTMFHSFPSTTASFWLSSLPFGVFSISSRARRCLWSQTTRRLCHTSAGRAARARPRSTQ